MFKRSDREILALAIPSIITNITTPLLSLMDVVIVGHMGDASYIAAIAVGGTMFNMLYWLFGFLRMGTSGFTAQANGARDDMALWAILYRGAFISLVASAVLIAFSSVIVGVSLSLMDAGADVKPLAAQYFNILIWGSPAVLLTYAFSGWFLGRKDSRTPMWISLVINLTNIAVSLMLVMGFGWKITGVATGTLVAQWTGALCFIACACLRYRPVATGWRMIFRGGAIGRFFKVNIDIFLRTLCLIAVTVWFTRTGARQDTLILAVNTLLMQFFVIFSYFMDGFAYAGESLCGNMIGAADHDGLRRSIRTLFKWGALTAILFTLVYAAGGTTVMNLLTDSGDVIKASGEYYHWVVILPLVSFAAFTWDGICIGMTATGWMLLSMLTATAVYFGVYLLCFPLMGNHGLWIAFLSYLAIRGVMLTILYKTRL